MLIEIFKSSTLRISAVAYSLQFKHPFRLAHGTRTSTDLVFLEICTPDHKAYGEASLPPYLKETQSSVIAYLKSLHWTDILIDRKLPNPESINKAAQACLSIALEDLKSKEDGVNLHSYFGLERPNAKPSSFTIAAQAQGELEARLKDAQEFSPIKLKLTGNNDLELLTAFRKLSKKPFMVDVNQGWQNREEAVRTMDYLSEMKALFLEQPLPINCFEDVYWLRQRSPLPIIADEDFTSLEQLPILGEIYSGVNAKLMKLGGIAQTIEALKKANEMELITILGAMAESSCALSAASHLAGLADYVDLDGPLLSANDPFKGLTFDEGRIVVPEGVGHGAHPCKDIFKA